LPICLIDFFLDFNILTPLLTGSSVQSFSRMKKAFERWSLQQGGMSWPFFLTCLNRE